MWRYSRNITPSPPSDSPIALFPDVESVAHEKKKKKEKRPKKGESKSDVGADHVKKVSNKKRESAKKANEQLKAPKKDTSWRRKFEAKPEESNPLRR